MAAWYRGYCNIPDKEWEAFRVMDLPLDKVLIWEDSGEMTLRELVGDVSEFPTIVGFED